MGVIFRESGDVKIKRAYKLWHECLDHIERSKFIKMKQNNLIDICNAFNTAKWNISIEAMMRKKVPYYVL